MANTLKDFCILIDVSTNTIEPLNYLGAYSIRDSKLWRRMLLESYMRSEDILDMIAGSVATMVCDKESDISAKIKSLSNENFYNIVCTFYTIKEDYLETTELEAENWSFKQFGKKNNRQKKDFGFLPIVDILAGGDVLKYDEVEQLDYSLAFVKVSMLAEQSWS